MQYTIEKSDGAEKIMLAGELSISSAEELKGVLLNALSASDQITLNLEQVTEVDLSSLQLLCSAHRTSIRMQKNLTRTGSCPGSLMTIAERAGYLRQRGCTGNCFWADIYELCK